MKRGLEDILDDLYDIDGIEACMLYRIDGIPIATRVGDYKEGLIDTMFWLEKQIKIVLRDMNKEGLKDTVFFFRKSRILIAPSTKATVLVTIMKEEANQQLISMETLRATKSIAEYLT